jgi:uncharacterized membrane protein YeaQ/YmgE (transglycosylase-associated protein family)
MLATIIFWIFFSAVGGAIASKKGRSDIGFTLLGLLLSPLIGIICALLAQPNQKVLDNRAIKSGKSKRCPFCAELIKPKASICKHCGKELPVKNEQKKDDQILCKPDSYDHEERLKNIEESAD